MSRSISGVKLQNAIENLDPATFYKPCLSKVMTAAAQQQQQNNINNINNGYGAYEIYEHDLQTNWQEYGNGGGD